MVNRALTATAPVLVIAPAIRAAICRPNCFWPALRTRCARHFNQLRWWSVYAALIGLTLAALAVVPILGLMIVCVIVWRLVQQRQQAADTEYGSARWADIRDLVWRGYVYAHCGIPVGRVMDASGGGPQLALDVLKQFPKHNDQQAVRVSQGIWLGAAKHALVTLPEREIIHAAIYGRSGSGKSQGHAIASLLTDYTSSAVVSDNKGELSLATARHRAEMFGQEIVCIAPFGGVPEGFEAHAFNPLSVVNLKSPHLVSDAIHFAKALIRPDKQDHNPFFVKSAIIVLDAVLSFLLCHAVPSQCTLQKLREITVNPDALKSMAEIMLQSDHAGGYLKFKAQQLLSLTGKTLMDVLATLNTQLFWIDSVDIEHATSWTTFNIQNLLAGKQTIYLIFPTDRAEDYSALIRVWITAIAHAIFAAGTGRSQTVRFYFDEASLLGQDMPVLERMLTKGRGYGIKMNFYWQSVHQIEEVFPEHQAQVFREQMSYEQFMEVSNYQTAKEVSQWVGQRTVRVTNGSWTEGWSSSETNALHPSSTWGTSGSSGGGYQKAGRALIQPEELLQMPSDQTVILKPGCPPILARKLKAYLQRDYAALSAMPFGEFPDLNDAKCFRLFIVLVVLLSLGGFCWTHPKDVQQIRQTILAAWDKQHPTTGNRPASTSMQQARIGNIRYQVDEPKPKPKQTTKKTPRNHRRYRVYDGYRD